MAGFQSPFATTLLSLHSISPGAITVWHGAIVDIPDGWFLCDGNNDTLDLQNRFIIGAGGLTNPGSKSGNVSHSHSFTGNGHTHYIGGETGMAYGEGADESPGSNNVSGTTDAGNHLPEYYALAYIQYKGV